MSDFEKWFRTRMVHSDCPVYESAKEGYEAATEAMQAKLDAQEKELAALRDFASDVISAANLDSEKWIINFAIRDKLIDADWNPTPLLTGNSEQG
jgi:aminoglycoside/choline kinase family phosphotransferase